MKKEIKRGALYETEPGDSHEHFHSCPRRRRSRLGEASTLWTSQRPDRREVTRRDHVWPRQRSVRRRQ